MSATHVVHWGTVWNRPGLCGKSGEMHLVTVRELREIDLDQVSCVRCRTLGEKALLNRQSHPSP